MNKPKKAVRQSVSLPPHLAHRVRTLAKKRRVSTNRVLVELIETGMDSKQSEKERFFALTDRLRSTSDRAEQEAIKRQLARMTFGE